MSYSASAYDAWLTRDPWGDMPDIPLPGDPDYPTCTAGGGCGAFLRMEPDDRSEGWQSETCSGKPDPQMGWTQCGQDGEHEPHDEVIAAWTTERRICRRCGRNNYKVVA